MRRLLPAALLLLAIALTACDGDDEPQSAPEPARTTGEPAGAPPR